MRQNENDITLVIVEFWRNTPALCQFKFQAFYLTYFTQQQLKPSLLNSQIAKLFMKLFANSYRKARPAEPSR